MDHFGRETSERSCFLINTGEGASGPEKTGQKNEKGIRIFVQGGGERSGFFVTFL